MPVSEARISANRQNALKSTGPRTPEGKALTRRNSLKHGMTGSGVVLTPTDAAELERRNEALQAELAPGSTMGKILVRKMALTSVRMERLGKQEIAAIALRVRHAVTDFDQERLDEVDQLFEMLPNQPRTAVRKLKNTPEGVERLLEAWQDLRENLAREALPVWTPWHRERAENLLGLKLEEASGSRIGSLSKAAWGDFSALEDGDDLEGADRSQFARLLLLERIDAEIAALETLYESLDFETLNLDRAEAPDRALFDPSREASLARRYEADASREFTRAFNLLLEVEAGGDGSEEPAPSPDPIETCEPLASFREDPAKVAREPRPRDGFARPGDDFEVSAFVEGVDRPVFGSNSRK